jgi:tol-pal system protein YbgF
LDELDRERQKSYELQTQLDSERNKPKTSSTPAPSGFRARYDEALEKYHSRNYRAAIDLFDQLLVNNPGNSLADNCQYWIGECHYALGDYTKAIAAFEKVFSFNNSNKNDDAQLKLGMCYWRLNDVSRAKEEFERLISHYPDSEYTPLARKYINRM